MTRSHPNDVSGRPRYERLGDYLGDPETRRTRTDWRRVGWLVAFIVAALIVWFFAAIGFAVFVEDILPQLLRAIA